MKIAVLSDTHSSGIEELPPKLVNAIAEADMILHLGDYVSQGVIDGLKALGHFEGVCGNADPYDIKQALPDNRVLEVEGKRIGMVHGWGSPEDLEERVCALFSGVDAILYGHSHRAVSKTVNGVLVFNPGSAIGRHPATYASYGILTIGEGIETEIVKL
jgi:putative phosphoesterase